MKCLVLAASPLNLLVPVLLLSLAQPGFGGPKVTVGRTVAAAESVSMDQIDHRVWDALLTRYVDDRGNVAYAAWKGSAQDVQALDAYLATLSTADPRRQASKNAVLAFWTNAYNAVTVRGILREYPTSSIRNHAAKLIGYNIWKDLLLLVGGQPYSLDQIEHEILRKRNEPRIHFAIVCASRSCPRLLNRAYTAADLENQLVTNTKAFFADPANFRHDAARRVFHLSSILSWFADDFGSDQASRLRTIAPYLPTREAYQAALSNAVTVSYLDYDWGLNDQTAPQSGRR
jgi:hypothetical protein